MTERARSKVNVHDAKTHLSRLLARVQAGETIVIAKAGREVALLVPIDSRPALRPMGMDRGLYEVPEDFDAPLSEEEIREFES